MNWKCPTCQLPLVPHCLPAFSRTCDLVRCTNCGGYGTKDLARWHAPSSESA